MNTDVEQVKNQIKEEISNNLKGFVGKELTPENREKIKGTVAESIVGILESPFFEEMGVKNNVEEVYLLWDKMSIKQKRLWHLFNTWPFSIYRSMVYNRAEEACAGDLGRQPHDILPPHLIADAHHIYCVSYKMKHEGTIKRMNGEFNV